MLSSLEDIDSQGSMAHCLLTEESATVTPQKSLRTPLKMIGGHLLNRNEIRTPNSMGRSKMVGFYGGNNALEAMSLGASPRIFGTPCTKSANRAAASGGVGVGVNTSQRPPVQKHRVYNPFDAALIEHLQSPIFSPSVFAMTKTPASSTKTPTFRWNIDELALIKPVNFDEAQDGYTSPWELEVESRAQMAIDDFFARNHVIVPSPCERERGPMNSRRSVATDCFHNSSQLRRVSEEKTVADVGCQTTLTLPVDFALDRLLADYYTYNSTTTNSNNSMGGDDIAELSNLSLRRKLFSNAPIDTSFNMSVMCPDGVDIKSTPSSCLSPHVSPVCGCRTPEPGSGKTINTIHASGYFSSSPIKNLQKSAVVSSGSNEVGLIRRSSTAPRLLDSPSLSPFEKYAPANKPVLTAAVVDIDQVSPLAALLSQGHDTSATAVASGLRSHQNRCEMTPGLSPIFGFTRSGTPDGTASTPSPADVGLRGKKDIGKLPLPLDLWDDEALALLDDGLDGNAHPLSTTPLQKQNQEPFLWQQESSSIAVSCRHPLRDQDQDRRQHHQVVASSSMPLAASNSQQESGFQSGCTLLGNSLSLSGLFNIAAPSIVLGGESSRRHSASSSNNNLIHQFQYPPPGSSDGGIDMAYHRSRDSLTAMEGQESRMSVIESSCSGAVTTGLDVQWYNGNQQQKMIALAVESEEDVILMGEGDSVLQFRDESMSFEPV